jgi:hypothetical protein
MKSPWPTLRAWGAALRGRARAVWGAARAAASAARRAAGAALGRAGRLGRAALAGLWAPPYRALALAAALACLGLLAWGGTPFARALAFGAAVATGALALLLQPAPRRAATAAYLGPAPYVLVPLLAALLVAAQVPRGRLGDVASYSYALRFALGAAAVVFLVYLLPPAWRQRAAAYVLFPALVPLLVIVAALAAVQAPRQAAFQARLVAARAEWGLPDGEVTFECPRLAVLLVPGAGTSVTLPSTTVEAARTTAAGLKARRFVQDVRFAPLGAGPGAPPSFYRLSVRDPGGKADEPGPARVRVLGGREAAGDRLRLSWDHNNPDLPLRVEWPRARAVAVEQVKAFELYFRNCHWSAGAGGADVGEQAQALTGRLPAGGPVQFDLGDGGGAVELYLPKGNDPKLAAVGPSDFPAASPLFERLHSGKVSTLLTVLNVNDRGAVEWKEKEDIPPQRLRVQGTATVRWMELQPDGLHVLLQGQASSIQADDSEQLSDWLSVLVKANAIVAIGAFVAWSIDKIFSYLSVRQAAAPPPPPGPGPPAAGS